MSEEEFDRSYAEKIGRMEVKGSSYHPKPALRVETYLPSRSTSKMGPITIISDRPMGQPPYAQIHITSEQCINFITLLFRAMERFGWTSTDLYKIIKRNLYRNEVPRP